MGTEDGVSMSCDGPNSWSVDCASAAVRYGEREFDSGVRRSLSRGPSRARTRWAKGLVISGSALTYFGMGCCLGTVLGIIFI